MGYNDNILIELNKLASDKNATIEVVGLSVNIKINEEVKSFSTFKLAKIYLQDYQYNNNISIETNSSATTVHLNDSIPTSGIVIQKNDEPIKKRRGRPKKDDNDRTSRI